MTPEIPKELEKKFQEIAFVLGQCQMIEEMMKVYIDFSFKLIKKRVGSDIEFGFSRSDYENSSLERLLTVFQKLCNNKALIKKLKLIVKFRNHVAHKAIYMELRSIIDKKHPYNEEFEIIDLHSSVATCFSDLMTELQHLYAIGQSK